ncbi:MAG: ABC transporter ATP-binding protein [Patescibacteria group bacterium]
MTQKTLTGTQLFKRVLFFAKPFKKPLSIVFICILGISISSALNNWCLSKIFDVVQKHGTDLTYLSTALWLVGGAAILAIIRIMIVGYQSKIEINELDIIIANHLNKESISKFFSFSTGQHVNEHSGVKQNIINNGTSSIQNQINIILNQLFPASAQLIVSLGVLFYGQWLIGLMFLGAGIIFSWMMYIHNKKVIPGIRKMRDRKQSNSRLLSELFRFVGLVKNESQEDRSLNDVSIAQQKLQDIYEETWIPGLKRIQLIRWVSNIISYSIRLFVVYLLFNGRITIGTLFLVFTYSSIMIDSLWQLTNIHKQFLMDRINIERYFEMLDVTPDIVMIKNPVRPEKFFGKIEFKNVSFWYPKRIKSYDDINEDLFQDEPVLKSISLTINAGEKIGIVGESGSGKSTIANLLRRGFDPQDGQILIDGNDLRLLDLSYFLQNIGSVEQEVVMFDRSIRDNILFGLNGKAKTISDDRLHEIAKLARIDGFFERLEHGFNTVVGEKGVKLSGGERQRIGIARALAKEPSILIFDEATSALDSVSERIVQNSIDEVSKGKTAIVIAHRLSTVKNCDRILVFRHGILLAEGNHDELISSCEYYADLAQHQLVS